MKSFNNLDISTEERTLFISCKKITERLQEGSIFEDTSVFELYDDDRNFSLFAKSIKESIQNNDPESGSRSTTYVYN